jgi:hypothetical protein
MTMQSCPHLLRASTSCCSRHAKDVDGRDIASEATPSFRRLCPAMTISSRPAERENAPLATADETMIAAARKRKVTVRRI